MKAHWKSTTIGAISEIVTKGTTPTSLGFKFTESGINFVKVETITPNGQFLPSKFGYIDEDCHQSLKRSQLVSGDILFSIAGALGRTAQVTHEILPANTNQALAIIRLKPSHEVMSEFILRALSSGMLMEQIEKQRGGVAQQNLSLAQVKNFQIPLPPLSEQKRIVAILDEAFEGIDRAIANTEKNLANSRELFESCLNSIFTQKGDGWVEKKLEDICEVKDGTHDSPKYVESGIPFITQKNIRENGLTFENIKFISSSDHEKFYSRSNVAFGDILISMIGANRGMACVVDKERIFSIKNVGLIKKSENINRYFLLYFLKSEKAQLYVESASRGGAQPFIGLGKLRKFPVSVAPQDSQVSIVMKLDELYSETQRLQAIYLQKIAALNELKQSILQKAFTGELTADTPKTVKEEIAA